MAKFQSGGIDIGLEIFQPPGVDRYPAIVVAYGTRGLNDPFGKAIRDFATTIAAQGYLVAIPYYFERTKTTAASDINGDALIIEAFVTHRDTWIETIQDCVTHIARLSNVKNNQIGLLAFSMGGHLSLRLAKSGYTPKINALVEFFAPITQPPFNSIGNNIDRLPPVQIHHGEDDKIVSPDQSRGLEKQLIAAGNVYEIFFYPGEGHGFTSPTAIADSTQRTIDFFNRYV